MKEATILSEAKTIFIPCKVLKHTSECCKSGHFKKGVYGNRLYFGANLNQPHGNCTYWHFALASFFSPGG